MVITYTDGARKRRLERRGQENNEQKSQTTQHKSPKNSQSLVAVCIITNFH